MDLGLKTASKVADDRRWLANPKGIECDPATFDFSAFTEADHYPNGYICSGIVVGKVTASSLYIPWDSGASDGSEVARGIIYTAIPVDGFAQTDDPTGAVMYRGNIKSTDLPTQGAMTDGGWAAAAAAVLTGIEDRA